MSSSGVREGEPFMDDEAREVSWFDSARLQLHLSIPAFLLGLVAPNRFALRLFVKWGAGERAARFLRTLRDKYGCDHLWVWFPLRRTLIVMAPATMDAVLGSDDNAPDPMLKKRALSRFVPDGLIVSSNPGALERRRFNTHALDLGQPHRHSAAFVTIAAAEAARLAADRPALLRWADFQMLGERISHQVILGMGQHEPELARHLMRMVTLSNWLLRDVPAFSAFYARLDQLLKRNRNDVAAAPTCLMHDAATALAEGSATTATKVPAQIGFWFFVLRDAIELHVARTLALIAAHPEVQARVRQEVLAAGPLTATSIDGLRYLEACIAEQLRLWTPVPLLLRRAVKDCVLGPGIPVKAEQQLLIHAGAYHRDPRIFGDLADTFSPDAACGTGLPKVYFFSDQGRGCAGRSLVMFVLKATLAPLLGAARFELAGPAIQPGRIATLYDHFAIELKPLRDA
jgi:cytochrome P450